MPKLQARDSGIWWGTLNKLQLMLRKASQVGGGHCRLNITMHYISPLQALHANGDFSFDQMHHYRMAVTEREVRGREEGREGGVVLMKNTQLHLQVINGCLNVNNVKDHVIIYTR